VEEAREGALSPSYNFKELEEKWYSFWESSGYFKPQADPAKKPYTVVIPPPNVTGVLHMGHALNNTVQDILVRWQRMKGVPALWVPGTDHAGIATQNVVEKKLAREGKSRFDLGREAFVAEVWKWKEEYGSTIIRQLRRLGASCDWARERFTMDEGLSRAVRETFVKLYEEDLVYQGNYIINWCPRCRTALSDEEAPHKEVEGKLYFYRYLVKDPNLDALGSDDQLIIATTRPETMLGDTAIAVNPKDKRYAGIENKEVYLPLQNRKLRVIKDDLIDPEFGTGIVKVTPAHDPNDFEMGHRHQLESRNILHPDGRINENGAPYENLDRFEARKKILEDLKAAGLFVREEAHTHKVPHCYRCDTVVEPYLSKQWFVRMKPLAEEAIRAQKEGKVKFFPKRWTKVYLHWLKNIRDWCVSRQIWWGHQIPVWYCDACAAKQNGPGTAGVFVSREDLTQCPRCQGPLRRDEDVLDTWFSSWLWPFSTLGWPNEQADDLKYFYPTSSLVTAQEILYFWVARMIMAGLHFRKAVPFSQVYIHGTVRTDSGQKMSKSLGNAIDPLEVIGEIGTDGLRFSIIMLTASGQDAYLSREKFELGRNFTNKIWNAARFALMNLDDFKASVKFNLKPESLTIVDRWILSLLQQLIGDMDSALKGYRFNDAASAFYHFFWHQFCDWYLEAAKPVLNGFDWEEKEKTLTVLLHVFETSLKLLHPFMPYISEEIWQRFKTCFKEPETLGPSIMIGAWPKAQRKFSDPDAERRGALMQRAVSGIRDLRAKLNVPHTTLVTVTVKAEGTVKKDLELMSRLISHLGKLEKLEIVAGYERGKDSIGNVYPDMEIYLRTGGLVNFEEERKKLSGKIEETRQRLSQLEGRLGNESFVTRAPKEIVEKEKARCEELKEHLASLEENLNLFSEQS